MSTRLVKIDAAALPAGDATVMVAEKLGEAIAEGGSFQAMVWMPESTERPKGLQAVRAVRMLKKIRPGLAEHCAGLAFVATAATKAARPRSAEAEARMWGCPVMTVTTEEEAQTWLAAQTDTGAAR